MVADGGTPPKTNTATATIDVNRNLFAPVWQGSQSVASVTVDETLKPGSGVYTVRATDNDLRVSFSFFWISCILPENISSKLIFYLPRFVSLYSVAGPS